MEIVIGAAPRIGQPGKKAEGRGAYVEAKVLSIRPPRRRKDGPETGRPDRRNRGGGFDSATSRVLVLMVPEGHSVPRDIDSGNYRVFLRFAPKRK